ncbi:MAG TPA: glycoside hydrolase family 2 protein, partial [Pyrinomonadaceae bacterium]|nr:glycoside hydrolase family 2 protein [Pyrinomonadaceae bacterium]
DDPFYRDNEKRLQWIGKTDWEYRTNFNVSAELLKRRNIEIVFHGLDTYANVFLNDAPVLSADNMFRTWRVDIKKFLKPGQNTIRIRFRSPINEILPIMAKLDYELPASNDQGEKTSPYTRKAPYQYGWDWGPRFVTSGIWKPVELVAWDDGRVDDLHIKQNSLSNQKADLTAAVDVVASSTTTATIELEDVSDKKIVIAKRVNLTAGINQIEMPFTIANPRLWYPVGYGEQALYTFTAHLKVGGKIIDQQSKRTGLRTLELRQKPDQYGISFTFVINGIPIFGHGANWIPADSFPTRVTKEKYKRLLTSLRDANMNMVRVWGGGIYEDDYYYDLADELGILVWQDFMFACSMYPGDKAFLDNVRGEVIDNVKRLRDHPSIVIWVGNNEIETAWQHWGGWKDKNPSFVWEDYQKLFLRLLPETLAQYDPSRPYWQSSPSSNFQADSEFQGIGDTHYWQVWHGEKPFSEYEKQYPRFMSEYGFQSFPELETIKYYTTDADRTSIETPIMLAHQRHPRGNQLVRTYMLREYNQPKDFESFLYVSQVLQAEGIKLGAEHLRRIMPQNMGSLYWQANDCWPVASWSSMDYFGRWKALMYYTKRFYSPILVSMHVDDSNMNFFVVSDSTQAKDAELDIDIVDLNGKIISTKKSNLKVEPLMGKSYLSIPVSALLAGGNESNVLVRSTLKIGGETVSTNNYYFKPFKEMAFAKPKITIQVTTDSKGFVVHLSSDRVARAVNLYGVKSGFFEDNFFDLLPDRPVEVHFRNDENISLDEFRNSLKVRSLVDAF